MTLHVSQPSLRDSLTQVLNIAKQIDAEGLSAAERANVAVTYVVENSDAPWSLALQRQILSEAIMALQADMPAPEVAPAPEPVPTPVTPAPNAQIPAQPSPNPATPTPILGDTSAGMMTMANEVVRALSEILDFSELVGLARPEQEKLIHDNIRTLSEDRKMHLNGREVADLVTTVLADMLGLGPLEALLADERVTDIMVNGPHQVFVERLGKLELTPIKFRDNDHVFAVASRIVAAVGRRIDESQPMVDARLKDGSRVNVAVPPLAIDGPTITIRKFPSNPVKLDALVEGGSLTSQMAAFLGLAAFLRLNILISGGTGSGKTTLMNAMSQFIPEGERLVTIEDAAELRFQQPHVVRFETRPPNVEVVRQNWTAC